MPFLFVGDDPGLSLLPSKPLINLFTAGVLLKFRIRTSNSDGNYWGFCLFVCLFVLMDGTQHPPTLELYSTKLKGEPGSLFILCIGGI